MTTVRRVVIPVVSVMTLAMAQELFNAPGQLTMIAISNKGDARGGYAYTDEAESAIRAALRSRAIFWGLVPSSREMWVAALASIYTDTIVHDDAFVLDGEFAEELQHLIENLCVTANVA